MGTRSDGEAEGTAGRRGCAPWATSRRGILRGMGAGLGALALSGSGAGPVLAGKRDQAFPLFRRFEVGRIKLTVLHDFTVVVPDPQRFFGVDQPREVFREVCRANYIPDAWYRAFFLPVVVEVFGRRTLIGTGVGRLAEDGRVYRFEMRVPGAPQGGRLPEALHAAGIDPYSIERVALCHLHPDHIGGLIDRDRPAFQNAEVLVPAAERAHWRDGGGDRRTAAVVEATLATLGGRLREIGDGDPVAPGVTMVAAPGPTPGHAAYRVEAGSSELFVLGDLADHYVWSLAHPEWRVAFDADHERAARTRRDVLSRLADERVPFVGHHMPWPGVGFVTRAGEGAVAGATFRYLPASYQFSL